MRSDDRRTPVPVGHVLVMDSVLHDGRSAQHLGWCNPQKHHIEGAQNIGGVRRKYRAGLVKLLSLLTKVSTIQAQPMSFGTRIINGASRIRGRPLWPKRKSQARSTPTGWSLSADNRIYRQVFWGRRRLLLLCSAQPIAAGDPT